MFNYHLYRTRRAFRPTPGTDEAVQESYSNLTSELKAVAVENISHTTEDILEDPWWETDHNGINPETLASIRIPLAVVVTPPSHCKTVVKAVPVRPNWGRGIKYEPKKEKLFQKGTFADLLARRIR